MKTCYIEKISNSQIAIADLTNYYGNGMIITRLNVPESFREKGYGNLLLKQILADADKKKVTLFLEISPSGKMTYNQLEKWYLKHNFKDIGMLYKRLPIKDNYHD